MYIYVYIYIYIYMYVSYCLLSMLSWSLAYCCLLPIVTAYWL